MPIIQKCRICGGTELHRFLDLGSTPLANSFVKPAELAAEEPSYPLDVLFCRQCGLVQLGFVVPPEILFRNYIYFSSTSETIRKHFAQLAAEVLEKFAKEGELVVEIASNDGVLLRNFKNTGVRSVGVEPATNIAKVANDAGIATINDFFNSKSARGIASEMGRASVILANNVFAHVDDLQDIVGSMDVLLEDGGVAILEFPYLVDLYLNREFDTMYHEHLSYFSLKPLMWLFGRFGMEIFEAKRLNVHGGSIRIYVQRREGGRHKVNQPAIRSLLGEEERLGLHSAEAYDAFAKDVFLLKAELRSLLLRLKSDGKKIAAYGAPAKGNTLLNYCGIGRDILDFAVDLSPYKQNLLTPGMHIPVYGPDAIEKYKPDYMLVLAWNFFDEIARQQNDYALGGGHFIVPLPKPRII